MPAPPAKAKYFDMGRSQLKIAEGEVIKVDQVKIIGIDPAVGYRTRGEVLVPKFIKESLNTALVFEQTTVDVDSFRKAWEKVVREASGKMFGIDTASTDTAIDETPEIPKSITPYGNLYRRKLRIRK